MIVLMANMTCNRMRGAILVSGAFLAAGILLHVIGASFSGHWGVFSLLAWYASFALILGSPVILLSALLFSLLPGAGKWSKGCNH